MQAVCQEGIGGCAIGVGNDTEAEPDDGAIVQAGELDVIFAAGEGGSCWLMGHWWSWACWRPDQMSVHWLLLVRL